MKSVKDFFKFDTGEVVAVIIFAAIVLVVTIVLARLIDHFFKKTIQRLKVLGNTSTMVVSLLRYVVLGVVYFAGIMMIVDNIPPLNNMVNKLLTGSGIVALVVGLASQEAVGNIVGGFMILTFKPFVIGDSIRYIDKNIIGTVEDITLRHTTIRTPENKRVIVPNGTINKEVIENANYLEDKVCVFLDVGIAYEADIQLAMDIMLREVMSHPDYYDNRTDEERENGAPPVVIRVVELTDSAVRLRAWLWAKDNNTAFAMKCDLLRSIKTSFDRDGVDIPYPHMVVVDKKL